MVPSLVLALDEGTMAVRTDRLSKSFGGTAALRGLDLQVPEGAVYVLVGPNGAGKSTALKVLLDLVRADSGTAEVFGLDTRREGPRVRAQIGYVPERSDWSYGWMKVGRLLEHHSAYYPTWDPTYAARLARALELKPWAKYGALSKGEQRRVQLVLAMAHRPPLLLLDEPTDGLDPVVRDEVLGLLAEHLAASPTTMLISTHLVHEVARLADHMGALREGRLVAQLPCERLREGLRLYRAEVPEGWSGVPGLNGAVLKRAGVGREVVWSIWGEEPEVVARLNGSGAVVRDVVPLSLEDATLALLSRKD